MKRKILAAALSVLTLTACGKGIEGDYSETVIQAESASETELADIGIFLPIYGKRKADPDNEDLLRPYVEDIVLAESLLRYADMQYYPVIPYAGEPEYPNEWAALDKSFVSDMEELEDFFRSAYTDDYYENVSLEDFKEEDGAVWRRINWGGKGVNFYDPNSFDVRTIDGSTAEIGMRYIWDHGYGYEVWYLQGGKLSGKGEEYGVRTFSPTALSFGTTERFEIAKVDETIREGTIGPESVFTYFSGTTDEYIEVNGERYYRTENYYPIDGLRKAFSAYISEYKWEWSDEAEDFVQTEEQLLAPCIEKYIDSVYIERDGALYRKESAPVYQIDSPALDEDGCVKSAQVYTPALGNASMQVCLYEGGETAMSMYKDGSNKLVTDIPVKEVDFSA